jgi:hypothetical protein
MIVAMSEPAVPDREAVDQFALRVWQLTSQEV